MNLDFLTVPLPEIVLKMELEGRYRDALKIIREWLKRDISPLMRHRLEYEIERISRLKRDFPYSRERAIQVLRGEISNFSEDELERWMKEGVVDYIIFEGKPMFFGRFVDNLIFLKPSLRKRRKRDKKRELIDSILRKRIDSILKGEKKRYRIRAGIRLKILTRIPREDTYRVWLPYPKPTRGVDNIRLVYAKPSNYYISPEDAPQRTIYFESRSREYAVEFEYVIEERAGGGEGAVDEKVHLGEKLPHISFTPLLKDLANHIAGDDDDDYRKAKNIYEWITRNVRYTYVREYGTYENIGEYVATNLRGDCGFHAILFIALCRLVGIPAKWQSGWFVTPYYSGPHDWSEVFIEPHGWMPVDLSFGNIRRRRGKYHDFYFGNLDAFRMVANDDLLAEFEPPKMHYRSDPVDNQRGEVEWSNGNIYYGGFEWEIYLRELSSL